MPFSRTDLAHEALQLTSAVGEIAAACPGGCSFTSSKARTALMDALYAIEFMMTYTEETHRYGLAEAYAEWLRDQDADYVEDRAGFPTIRKVALFATELLPSELDDSPNADRGSSEEGQ